GNGISHPLHVHHFGIPGKTLLGSDSHTPSSGALGILAIGTGGLDVAMCIAGVPYPFEMPKICGVELKGKLPPWVSAKDVILEMLRRIGVRDGRGWIFEYFGEGLKCLSVMDRFVIANMGTEMGATSSVFPSDEETLRFLKAQERESAWIELKADDGATYDKLMSIDLSALEPLIAKPGSPGDVVPVREVAGQSVHQVVIGSSANPGLRDFFIVSEIVKGRVVPPGLSFDVNPPTRQVIENLSNNGQLAELIKAGARFHQTGCLGCIGMGQAPAAGKISLRTMPRNFPGRSGTHDDKVFLCSPETAAASALSGQITDPRDLEKTHNLSYPQYKHPEKEIINLPLLFAPLKNNVSVELEKGSNIKPLPEFKALKETFEVPVLLKLGDDISTDGILMGGTKVLPLRSNIPAISKWLYHRFDPDFYNKAVEAEKAHGGHIIVAGKNYAQGSSREHAAIAPKFLGQIAVIAKSYARIGWQNLVNFGILPFEFVNEKDYDDIQANDMLFIDHIDEQSIRENKIRICNRAKNTEIHVKHKLSERQIQIILEGGKINHFHKEKRNNKAQRQA
ncbi:MAG: aconitate hydratase, partial [Bacteroidia bacterium]